MRYNIFAIVLLLFFTSCKTKQKTVETKNEEITFKFVQLNDVYEIAPLSGGKYGGMARVAHVVDSIRAVQPNTYLVMAGDFLNPSLLGTLKHNGERIRGKQMVEVMNAMNFELVTFGNHEFDIGEDALQQRMDESNFYWTSANVFQNNDDGPRSFFFRRNGDSIYVPETYSIQVKNEQGKQIDVGLFGVTIGSNPQEFVHYADYELEAKSAYTKLKMRQTDIIVGLTHLKVEDDVALSNMYPDIKLIMGGHEHHNMLVPTNNGVVAKADANAKSIYVHSFTHIIKTGETNIDSELVIIDENTASQPKVKAIVDKWNLVLEKKIKEVVSNPHEVIYIANTPLDGTDSASRGVQTNLGGFIAESMAHSFDEDVDAAIVNGGSIRIDDQLSGNITSLDIFRVLPFGGEVLKVQMTGELLNKVLDYGKSKGGTGAYLQRFNLEESATGGWNIGGQTVDESKIYKIAVSDYLMKGLDIPILSNDAKGVKSVYSPKETEAAYDIRKAIILFLKKLK